MANFINPWATNQWSQGSEEGDKFNVENAEVVEVEEKDFEKENVEYPTFGILGMTKYDIKNFKKDLVYILEKMGFVELTKTIVTKKNKLIFSDLKVIEQLLNDATLTLDKKTLLQILYNTIQSTQYKFKIEYTETNVSYDENGKVIPESFSEEGTLLFINNLIKLGETPDNAAKYRNFKTKRLDLTWIEVVFNGGLTIPTDYGAYIIISGKLPRKSKALTALHEVFGHGVACTTNLNSSENQENGIRLNNLLLRILGESEEYRDDHNKFEDLSEYDPYLLPIIK